MLKFGLFIVVICASSTVALPPCVCTRNYRPVCGSDGVTYANKCLLDCENHKFNKAITLAREGSCEQELDPCICTQEFRPVCGTDGETYSNACVARCSRTEVASTGECDKVKVVDLPACTCTREKKPVCGSDGVTYSNPCMLNCATANNPTLHIENQGPCNASSAPAFVDPKSRGCTCGRNLLPVCSTEGVTYDNECLLNCAGKEKLKDTACEELQIVDF